MAHDERDIQYESVQQGRGSCICLIGVRLLTEKLYELNGRGVLKPAAVFVCQALE